MTPVATGTLSPQPGSQQTQSWLLKVNTMITQHRKKVGSEGFFIGSQHEHWLSEARLHRPHVGPISSVFALPHNPDYSVQLVTNLWCNLQLIMLFITTLNICCSLAQCGLLGLNPTLPFIQLYAFWKITLCFSFPTCKMVITLVPTSYDWDS